MEYKKACFIIRNKDYALDGMRSALGLAVENMYSYAHLLDTEIDKMDENNEERVEMPAPANTGRAGMGEQAVRVSPVFYASCGMDSPIAPPTESKRTVEGLSTQMSRCWPMSI